jgi:Ca2+-binding RTX toxin-like protein
MAKFHGTVSSEWLIGTRKGDTLYGYQGNDTLIGGKGDDYLNAEMTRNGVGYWLTGPGGYNWLSGGAGDDTLVGGNGSDALFGGPGNDLLFILYTGESVLHGEGGNDTLDWSDTLILANGGRGRDQLDVHFQDFDLRAVSNDRLVDIEIINFTDSERHQLTLTRKEILAMSSTTDTLTVLGDRGDSVDIVGPYRDLGVSGDFHRYKLGDAILLVDTDIKDVG